MKALRLKLPENIYVLQQSLGMNESELNQFQLLLKSFL